MFFMISNKNTQDILYMSNIERAKQMVSHVNEENGLSISVYGAKSKELFLLLYPEFKGRSFVSIGNNPHPEYFAEPMGDEII